MKVAGFVLVIALLFTGCDSSKRAQRLLRKAKVLDPSISQVDTLVKRIEESRKDTAFLMQSRDTVYIDNSRLQVRVERIPTGHPCDSVPVNLDIDALAKEIERIQTKETFNPVEYRDRIPWWMVAVLIAMGLALFFAILRK